MSRLRNRLVVGVGLCVLALGASGIELRMPSYRRPPHESPSSSLALNSEQKEALDLQPSDFVSRCQAPGVLVCQGFDSSDIATPAKWPASGLYPAGDNSLYGKFDNLQRASGRGSLRFEILTRTGANAAGYWRQYFGRSFGEGSTFYVQFRQRFSEEMLKNDWGDTTWKQVIFHNKASTCSDVELTTAQYYRTGIPYMYTDCGSRMLLTNNAKPPCKFHQGDYNCWYGNINPKDCFFYPANQWVSFYYQVTIGHWGRPDSAVNAWVGLDGKPLRQWIKMPGFTLANDHPGQDYDSLTLLTYMTNKDSRRDLPTAFTWYDELIVSTQPIAPPTAAEVP